MRTDHLADPPHCGGGLRYADQLVKGLLYRFRRAAATRVGIPWLRFIVRNWIFGDPPWSGDLAPWSLIFAEDCVLLDGAPIELRAPAHYFAFHKPEGVLTAASDPHDRLCLGPWLAELPPSVFPVGRLDRATTGFLLLTEDGGLGFCLLRPWFGVPKE